MVNSIGAVGCFGVSLLAHHHPATPKLDRRVYALGMARKQEGLPPARAGPEDPDLAVEVGLGAQPCHRTRGVADHLRIGDAALGPHLGGDIIGFAFAGAVVEVVG